MAQAFRKGTKVEWPWGRSHAEGKVETVYKESVSLMIKGKKITRHATPEKPAYLIRQENGNKVLKSETELRKSEKRHGWV